jgi:hypothetical protein
MVRLSESIVSAPPIDGVPHQGMDDSSLSRVRDARLRLTKTLRKLRTGHSWCRRRDGGFDVSGVAEIGQIASWATRPHFADANLK